MRLSQLCAKCGAQIAWMPEDEPDITSAYTSDLLSDVMAHCPEGAVLITIQNHMNTVAVATLTGAQAIMIAHNREIPQEMRDASQRENIALLQAPEDQFTLSCKIGTALCIP